MDRERKLAAALLTLERIAAAQPIYGDSKDFDLLQYFAKSTLDAIGGEQWPAST